MLGLADPLAGPLNAHGCKVYRFGAAHLSDGLGWPTVENVAALLARVGDHLLDADLQARVVRCRVTETHVNAAEWTAGPLSRVRLPVWGPLRTGRPPAVGMPTPGQR